MKKIGFTIAEILIAMGIIGIVTALTIPTLVQNNKKLVFAKTLVTTVGDFEVAMKTLMVTEDVSNLWETEAWRGLVRADDEEDEEDTSWDGNLNVNSKAGAVSTYVSNIEQAMPFESLGDSTAIYTKNSVSTLSGTKVVLANDAFLGNSKAFKSKEDYVYHISISSDDRNPMIGEGEDATALKDINVLSKGGNLSKIAAHVTIDINGSNRPNVIGRDIFKYVLGADGKLYPLHSRDYCVYQDVLNGDSDASYTNPKTECDNQNGDYCAAYLQENGYNMDY